MNKKFMNEKFRGMLEGLGFKREAKNVDQVIESLKAVVLNRANDDVEVMKNIMRGLDTDFDPAKWNAFLSFVQLHRPNIGDMRYLSLREKNSEK